MSGGLLSAWNNNFVEVISVAKSRNWIWVRGKIRASQILFSCINVYASQSFSEKCRLFSDLAEILKGISNEPMALIGDFNCVLRESERKNCK